MAVKVKICGIASEPALNAAIAGGAAFLGFNFYPPSPRYVAPSLAAELASAVPGGILRVGLFVDADDATIAGILAAVPLDMLQLHGRETPERAAAIRAAFGLPVMKVLGVGEAADLERAKPYEPIVDWLMFDAKPPKDRPDALPGGNARAFDWSLLAGRSWSLPWMLAGGLTPDNLAAAARISGALVLDVSSGVEDAPGRKSPAKIRAFLEAAAAI